MKVTVLDGPVGTQLAERGVAVDLPLWSAAAIEQAPQVVAAIHRDYRAAGATVHTTNTFRTKRRTVGDAWQRLTRKAVELARQSVDAQRLAGCISPLEDCYRPDLSPPVTGPEHEEMATWLCECGCDLLLCETFPHVGEATEATRAAVATGLETWVAFTAGPDANLLTPAELSEGGKRVVDAGASAVLVNCTPAADTLRFVEALEKANLGVPLGAYANAGSVDDQLGWRSPAQPSAARYLRHVKQWVDAGATIVGGCCGTGPAHIAAIAEWCKGFN